MDAKHIRKKMSGYKQQDLKNKIYSEPHFITSELILEKLKACDMKCLYCKQDMFNFRGYYSVKEINQHI